MTEQQAVIQRSFRFKLPRQCPVCAGFCGYYVDVIYLFAGRIKEWHRCGHCKGRGSV